MSVIQKHGGYRFGSLQGLDRRQMEDLIAYFRMPAPESAAGFPGRKRVLEGRLRDFGPVMIKPYFRGGVLGRINERTYLAGKMPRCQAEFERLLQVRQIGVNAPHPVAFAVRGQMLYHAWLITKQLPDVRALSVLSRCRPEAARRVLPAVVEQIRLLIRHGIHHVDLHPGNVLVDGKETVYIVDFDKAAAGREPKRLDRLYVSRWRRAVIKHGLPRFLYQAVETGLHANP